MRLDYKDRTEAISGVGSSADCPPEVGCRWTTFPAADRLKLEPALHLADTE
jgi:hypothetical protein